VQKYTGLTETGISSIHVLWIVGPYYGIDKWSLFLTDFPIVFFVH